MANRGLTPYSSQRGLWSGDPWQMFHREMDRLFDDIFRGGALTPFAGFGQGAGQGGQRMMSAPRVDVHETKDQLCVTADLPGIKQSEIDVRIDGDVLTISGERRDENEDKQPNYHVMERSFGRFSRSVQLPFAPDPQRVEARFADGVLRITVPTEGQVQRSRRIEIRGGEAAQLQESQRGGAWSQGGTSGSAQQGSSTPPSSTMLQGERGAGTTQQQAGGGASQTTGTATQGQQGAGSRSAGTEPIDNLPG